VKAVAKHLSEHDVARIKRAAKLGAELREAYAEVLAEPCPQSMLDLLDELRAQESKQTKRKD
tara:strand:+ start:2217 stop:2402 length:186 start_codon:yes stop_codon:yes gene_type:complete